MPVAAVAMAVLCLYVVVNRRTRSRGFERGRLRIERIQPWTSSGESTATMTRTYKVHGVVSTSQGSFSATSVDLYDEGILSKEGRTVPCRFDPKDPSRVTLTMSDPSRIGLQDVVLVGFAGLCLVIAWFTR